MRHSLRLRYRVLTAGPAIHPACKTTYRPNYSVTEADSPLSVRRYNTGVAEVIEAAEHYYFDSHFMSLVRAQMAFAQCVFACSDAAHVHVC